jgi:60 kDa SS-A/Ro ribonucleoprotein
MVASYLDAVKTVPEDTRTHEGGLAFTADTWAQLRRFLVIGTESGTFYAGGRELTVQSVGVVKECLDEDWHKTLGVIADVSQRGLAPKNDPAILALAIASLDSDRECRREVFKTGLRSVCRIPTHLMHFVAYREALGGGWGRGMKRAIQDWYSATSMEQLKQLAYHAVKYPSRDGWSQRDLLRLGHPSSYNASPYNVQMATSRSPCMELAFLLRYIARGPQALEEYAATLKVRRDLDWAPEEWANLLVAVERIRRDWKEMPLAEVCTLIADYDIPREALPTELLNEPAVWSTMLVAGMPMTAMIRNLGKMSAIKVLEHNSQNEQTIVTALMSEARLKQARIHPISLLAALKVYERGHGEKGKLTWSANKRIVSALDEAFYLAFGAVSSTGKRVRLALDVSGSMTWSQHAIQGMPFLSCRDAAAAMALVTVATEPNADVVAYSDTMVPLTISPNERLDSVARKMSALTAGGTVCSMPMIQAIKDGELDIDGFVSYTDNETHNGYRGWGAGYVSTAWGPRSREEIVIPTVSESLKEYRHRSGRATRHAVVAMAVNELTLADPSDTGQLDVCGFDSSTPAVLSSFMAGEI